MIECQEREIPCLILNGGFVNAIENDPLSIESIDQIRFALRRDLIAIFIGDQDRVFGCIRSICVIVQGIVNCCPAVLCASVDY